MPEVSPTTAVATESFWPFYAQPGRKRVKLCEQKCPCRGTLNERKKERRENQRKAGTPVTHARGGYVASAVCALGRKPRVKAAGRYGRGGLGGSYSGGGGRNCGGRRGPTGCGGTGGARSTSASSTSASEALDGVEAGLDLLAHRLEGTQLPLSSRRVLRLQFLCSREGVILRWG
jgi:hypothetical protein